MRAIFSKNEESEIMKSKYDLNEGFLIGLYITVEDDEGKTGLWIKQKVVKNMIITSNYQKR